MGSPDPSLTTTPSIEAPDCCAGTPSRTASAARTIRRMFIILYSTPRLPLSRSDSGNEKTVQRAVIGVFTHDSFEPLNKSNRRIGNENCDRDRFRYGSAPFPSFSRRGGCAINKKSPFLIGADGVVGKFK